MVTKKVIVCVFAHPDDEAFGPSGTITRLVEKNDVYILCATKGQAGKDSSFTERVSLGRRRVLELKRSAKILGVKSVHFLGFVDGQLCNNLYHELADKIQDWFQKLNPEIVITFEPRGISGHIDHITVSLATTFVFKKTKTIRELWYYCISEQRRALTKDYFIYFPPGYKKSEIDKSIDVSGVWETKVKAMLTHESQKHDAERILKDADKTPKEESFLILKQS